MMEAGILLDLEGKPLYFHTPHNRSISELPDSLDLWNVIWEHRDNISGFAHSHPGLGIPSPSWTDVTTFSAVEIGLGKKLDWPIISGDNMIITRFLGPGKYDYIYHVVSEKPDWFDELRKISNY